MKFLQVLFFTLLSLKLVYSEYHLPERRIIAEVNEKLIPDFKKNMSEFASYTVEVDIVWKTFGETFAKEVDSKAIGDLFGYVQDYFGAHQGANQNESDAKQRALRRSKAGKINKVVIVRDKLDPMVSLEKGTLKIKAVFEYDTFLPKENKSVSMRWYGYDFEKALDKQLKIEN